MSGTFKWKTSHRSQNCSYRNLCVVREVVQSGIVCSNVKTCMKCHTWPFQTSLGEIFLLYMQNLSATHHRKIRVLDLRLLTQKEMPVKFRRKVCTCIWKSIIQGMGRWNNRMRMEQMKEVIVLMVPPCPFQDGILAVIWSNRWKQTCLETPGHASVSAFTGIGAFYLFFPHLL